MLGLFAMVIFYPLRQWLALLLYAFVGGLLLPYRLKMWLHVLKGCSCEHNWQGWRTGACLPNTKSYFLPQNSLQQPKDTHTTKNNDQLQQQSTYQSSCLSKEPTTFLSPFHKQAQTYLSFPSYLLQEPLHTPSTKAGHQRVPHYRNAL